MVSFIIKLRFLYFLYVSVLYGCLHIRNTENYVNQIIVELYDQLFPSYENEDMAVRHCADFKICTKDSYDVSQ